MYLEVKILRVEGVVKTGGDHLNRHRRRWALSAKASGLRLGRKTIERLLVETNSFDDPKS